MVANKKFVYVTIRKRLETTILKHLLSMHELLLPPDLQVCARYFLSNFHFFSKWQPFKTIFLKEFLECNVCFWLFNKIKKGSGASFWYTFSAWFSHKNVPYLIMYQWTKFQCHTLFLSQDINQNVLLSS